jgi:conflict system pore-forming effector with SLATT domain
MAAQIKLLDPVNVAELLRGWLLHAHKGRDRHDTAARHFEGRRVWFGTPTIVLTAVVGTSVFASIGQQPGVGPKVVVGLLSLAASVLSALQTFLDYQGRSGRHRTAAAKYKGIVHELEEVLATPDGEIRLSPAWFADLRQRFEALEQDMPVVAPSIYDEVEHAYHNVTFVETALDLIPGHHSRPSLT